MGIFAIFILGIWDIFQNNEWDTGTPLLGPHSFIEHMSEKIGRVGRDFCRLIVMLNILELTHYIHVTYDISKKKLYLKILTNPFDKKIFLSLKHIL